MSYKQNRAVSFFIVFVVYVAATALGIFAYKTLPATIAFYWKLLIADIAATVLTFIFSLIFGNASVYDPYWSVQPPVILVCFVIGKPANTTIFMLLFVVFFWATRLTANWAYTFKGLCHQDWRYTMLKERTGIFYPAVNLFGIHLVPTLIVYACILPAVFVIQQNATFKAASTTSLAICVVAVILQGTADIQMHRFRKQKNTATDSAHLDTTNYGFIRDGLWKYSRHPNYLGEILMWWGIGLAAFFALGNNPIMLVGATANTLLFLFISIPLAEKHQSRKPNFDEYKNATRMILPLPKKINPQH